MDPEPASRDQIMWSLVGDAEAVRTRLDAYAAVGLDEVVVVPATAGDPAGERTLRRLATASDDPSSNRSVR